MKNILVVDDSRLYREKARQALNKNYEVTVLGSAVEMFALLGKFIPDLILLDIEMAEMNGLEALKKLKRDSHTANIPVIFFTAMFDEKLEARGFELGAVDYIRKPFSTPVLLNRIASQLHADGLIKKRTEQIMHLKNSTLFVIAEMVENRDKATGGHIERTSHYIKILIDAMMSGGVYADIIKDWDMDIAISSARLHDVGKIAVPDSILNKPGKLTPEEMDIMRTHVSEGERIIERIISKVNEGGDSAPELMQGHSFLYYAMLFAGYHHENWDGSGYPRKLKGADIPLQGRIMAIADVYDALISERPYKKPFTHEQAAEIIKNDSGTKFDPAIAGVFSSVADVFHETALMTK